MWAHSYLRSSVVERLLPKQDIVGSSPITRSMWVKPPKRRHIT